MNSGSKIIIENGANYCNYGALFGLNPTIIIRSRNPSAICADNITQIYSNTMFVMEDSAVYVIPDSSTVLFDST